VIAVLNEKSPSPNVVTADDRARPELGQHEEAATRTVDAAGVRLDTERRAAA
jgi:hypothetical protein